MLNMKSLTELQVKFIMTMTIEVPLKDNPNRYIWGLDIMTDKVYLLCTRAAIMASAGTYVINSSPTSI